MKVAQVYASAGIECGFPKDTMAVRAARYPPRRETLLFVALCLTLPLPSEPALLARTGHPQAATDPPRLAAGTTTRAIVGGEQQRHAIAGAGVAVD